MYFKCKNKIIESEIANKAEEISSLKGHSKCEQLKKKTLRLEAVLKIRQRSLKEK